MNKGSIQGIDYIPLKIQEIYKTSWEMKMKDIIDMAADRGAFIDQSQSMNLWMEEPTTGKISSMHMYAWKKGLKTGMYYLRTQTATTANKNLGLEKPEEPMPQRPDDSEFECFGCGS